MLKRFKALLAKIADKNGLRSRIYALIRQKMRLMRNAAIKCLLLSAGSILIGGISFALPNPEGIQVYQKYLPPEHKQKLADDITRYRNADNLWDVLRDEFSLAHYEESYAVQVKIEWYMNNQDYLLRSASRAAPYLYYISQQVKKRHLPAELVLLPIVESGYNPFSVSNMGASGIWQLMPDTASGLGVKRDWWYDGRRDVIASTRAALNYLAYLQSFFEGNWLLAIAAYNTGEGNVLAAIKRNIRDGRDTDFWSLPLAQETRDYVPSLLALAAIISRPDKYPVYLPPVRNAPYLAQVDIGTQINLKLAAALAGISHQKLMQLNPGFKSASTSTSGPYKLVLPIENIEQFTENLARSPLNRKVNWIHYKVKSGDTLMSISRKFKTTTSDIRKMNHLSKSTIRPGTNLLIPHSGADSDDDAEDDAYPVQELLAEKEDHRKPAIRKTTDDISSKIKKSQDIVPVIVSEKNGNSYKLQPGDTIYMVRSKDTLDKIAKRFHISSQSLRQANRLTSNQIKPGKQIIIPTHPVVTASKKSPVPSAKKIQPGDTIYMVRRGDTIEKIARKFRTTASAIRINNLVDNSSLSEGDRLVIPTHIRG
ncbi:Membrane-bound lytic murein transglycosylase D [Aquicella siphonis]|uniref:Membrane-bound lytic murein transglycosylase D n=1 Tax=Aquicella siphonis TaxID=254247 RepID=A0A5E4PH10_9COXI|nr:LysM peptidoglycan-binding domain-containing protein [Aquicella siphonis]VVC75875.1 Membrane-bound lytic murein transglycosylase D [Aquicella siphonis]